MQFFLKNTHDFTSLNIEIFFYIYDNQRLILYINFVNIKYLFYYHKLRKKIYK